MFENFTDRARRVLVLAQQEAREAGQEVIAADHLLLGCVVERDGIAGRVLQTFSVTPDQLRLRLIEAFPTPSMVSPVEAAASVGVDLLQVKQAVEQSFGAGSFPLPGERPSFDATAREVLQAALDAALQWGHNYIGTEHLLLGLLRARDGQARASLESLGIDPRQVEQRTTAVVHRYTVVEQQPQRERVRDLRRGAQRMPTELRPAAREVLNATVHALPVMPLVASDAEFESWLSETEAQLGAAVERARAGLDALGALRFVDLVASLMKTEEAIELQAVVGRLRDEHYRQQSSESDDDDAVSALAAAVRRERRATELVDALWLDFWNRHAETSEADRISRVVATTSAIRALP